MGRKLRSIDSSDPELARYLRNVSRCQMLTPDEERQLAIQWTRNRDLKARKLLIEANLRFVISVALAYRGYGLALSDLVQEGNMGLVVALGKFDPNRGFRLNTYAKWWIEACIKKFILERGHPIKQGTTAAGRRLFFKLRREQARLQAMGIDPARIDSVIAQNLDVKTKNVEEARQRLQLVVSLDAPISDSDDRAEVEFLEDHKSNPEMAAEATVDGEMMHARIREAMAELKPRERFIIENRYLQERPLTLQKISEKFGVTRERIRQIEKRTLAALRRKLRDIK